MKFIIIGILVLFLFSAKSPSYIEAATIQESDVNKDGNISVLDLSLIAGDFGGIDPRYDLDGDGSVSILDLNIVSSYFTQSYATYTITTNDNPQTIINSAPAGSLFLFDAGTHRATSNTMITARTGDVFSSHQGAILSGAKVLTNWIVDGSVWRIDGQTQAQSGSAGTTNCRSGVDSCRLNHDLFIDNSPLMEVTSLGAVTAGKWFFDYANDKIYIGDNPTSKTVEVSQYQQAITCSCNGVHIRGLTIEKFSNSAQSGAVAGQSGNDWTVELSTLRLNHGAGYGASGSSVIMHNTIFKNGQLGLHASGKSNLWIEANTITYNNYAGYSDGWEAGGFKFATGGDNIYVFKNTSSYNEGPGMWMDYVGTGAVYRQNTVEYNKARGISHEISYDALIYDNIVRYNSTDGGDAWAFGAGILIQNSSNVEVYDNIVVVLATSGDGITVVHQNRNDAATPRPGTNNYIHNNEIWHLGSVGQNGIFADCPLTTCDSTNPFYKPLAWDTNIFDNNIYHVPSLTSSRWETDGSAMNWTTFRAAGQEPNGTADTNNTYP